MQHIDEALLHEYLDRAGEDDAALVAVETHLAECAGCRTRLEDAMRLRDAASGILRAAAPAGLEMPAFEEVLARENAARGVQRDAAAKAEATSAGIRSHRMTNLRRAASIVLIFGAGWMGKTIYNASEAPSVQLDGAPQTKATVTEPSAPNAAATDAPAAAPSAQSAVAERAQDRLDAPAAERERRAGAPSGAATSSALGRAANASAPGSIGDLRAGVGSAGGSVAGVTAASPPAPVPAPAPPPSMAKAREESFSSRNAAAAGNADATANRLSIAQDAVNADSATLLLRQAVWVSVSMESATRMLGGQLVRSADLPVLDYSAANGEVRTRVRVRQRSAAGDTIEVIQLAQPASLARQLAEASPAPVIPEALRDVPQYRTVSRGELSGRYYMTLRMANDMLVTVTGPSAASVYGWRPSIMRAPK